MIITVVGTPQVQGFGVSAGGFTYAFNGAGAPAVGDWDVLFVNSDATIQTPAGGFVASLSNVNSQGSYAFTRKAVGGEAGTVTITTGLGGGPFNATLGWIRVRGADQIDIKQLASVVSAANTTTPPLTTGVPISGQEIAIAYAALHGFPGAVPVTPVWGNSFQALAAGSQGAGNPGCAGFLGYIPAPAGIAAFTPTVSWTNSANDRDMLIVTLTEACADCPDCPDCPSCPPTTGITVNLTATNMAGIVTGLGSCAQQGLAGIGRPVCRACIAVPGTIAWDDCACECDTGTGQGQLAVTIGALYPSKSFPADASQTPNMDRCGPGLLVARVTVEVTRCVSNMDDNGTPPTCADLLADFVAWNQDATAIRNALGCCLRAMRDANVVTTYALGQTIPKGPDGGCVGSETTLLVAIPSCGCPGS